VLRRAGQPADAVASALVEVIALGLRRQLDAVVTKVRDLGDHVEHRNGAGQRAAANRRKRPARRPVAGSVPPAPKSRFDFDCRHLRRRVTPGRRYLTRYKAGSGW